MATIIHGPAERERFDGFSPWMVESYDGLAAGYWAVVDQPGCCEPWLGPVAP
jgi:hypothetical protein